MVMHISSWFAIAGAGLLVVSLAPVRTLIARLPPGNMRLHWRLLAGMILLFIGGYLDYAVMRWDYGDTFHERVMAFVLFLGACFVLLVNYFSLHTAVTMRRLAVLEQESITDPLMCIYNRRYLERRLVDEERRARRYDLPLSALMIDIDRFKDVNDHYGHQVGDVILHGLGKLITDTVRSTDIVARYGGEEILIVAPNTPVGTAARLADRLRLAVENAVLATPIVEGNKKATCITVSIGVAHLGRNDHDANALVQSADEAMYRAKREGRNRVAINS
jgi:diguanylate cyclase (GGDEF)-like protein